MATAVEVMKYIKSQMQVNGELQTQKLVYYAQAWSLAWDGAPLFSERIEAWRMGPVVRAIRFRQDDADDSVLSPTERATVDAVIEFYGRHHGQALADMTHAERPWADVWERRPEGADSCSGEITHEAMRCFYTEVALHAGDVPVRRTVYGQARDDELLEIAAANADRWRDTLAILAQ